MSQLEDALDSLGLAITDYRPGKPKCFGTNQGLRSLEQMADELTKDKRWSKKFPEVWNAALEADDLKAMLLGHIEKLGLKVEEKVREIPDVLKGLTLNVDLSVEASAKQFFLTTANETVSPVRGRNFLQAYRLQEEDAFAMARHVVPDYMPRRSPGVSTREIDGHEFQVFNTYMPAPWTRYDADVPDKLPLIFDKLVRHLFPISEEREFFFEWLHASLFKRAMTFLVLCGAPGTGKNRLKLVLRALHGHVNTVDGKKSTLVERFNSQLGESTLAWFDELHYDMDMENTMKELQNDSISIERKGVDATRATKIHASVVISNNKPRDNYIAFDARKFVPLKVTDKRLEMSMSEKEIDQITRKVEDQENPHYDVAFIAQIAHWVKAHGTKNRWKNLEYKGPMFWSLAHTSMSRWQKKAVTFFQDPKTMPARAERDSKKGYLWSSLAERSMKKHGDKSLQFPDNSSVRAFFEVFMDQDGKKGFETTPAKDTVMGDFYVRPLLKSVSIVTEASIIEQREKANGKSKKPTYDL